MRARFLLFALTSVLVIACASGNSGSGVATRLDDAARAIHESDFRTAERALLSVDAVCGDELLGRHALLLIAAGRLDPRNPDRDPQIAASLLAEYARSAETFPWALPVVETLFFVAIESGARAPAIGEVGTREGLAMPDVSGIGDAGCDELTSSAVRASIALPSVRIDRTPRREQALQAQIDELRAELERVRKAVQP